jgi:hypothetical protein
MFFVAGDVTVQPTVIEVPAGKDPIGTFPSFDDANGVGHTTIHLNYTVGAGGLAKGGGVDFAFAIDSHDASDPNFTDTDGWMIGPTGSLAQFPFGRFQVSDSTAPNYTVARTSAKGVTLTTSVVAKGRDGGRVLRVVTSGKPMRKNDTISVDFGPIVGRSPGATLSWHPGRPSVVYWEDLDASGKFKLGTGTFPQVLVTALTPQQLRVDLPVTAAVGKPFEATLQVLQGVDSPLHSLYPVELFAGTVLLECYERRSEKSLVVNFDGSERGCVRFKWTFARAGVKRIVATLLDSRRAKTEVVGISNPSDVRSAISGSAIYCGDLQRHACEGGHAAVADFDAWQTLWNRGDDFGCVIEHAANPLAGFLHAQNVAQLFQSARDPAQSRFVTFPGYEWTLSGQHRHVVHSDFSDEPAITDRDYSGAESPPPVLAPDVDSFLALVRGHAGGPDRIAIPHHMEWRQQGDDPAYEFGDVLDDPAQPLFEVFSMHGNSERWVDPSAPLHDYLMHFDASSERDPSTQSSVQSALAMGYRFGFVGGSDDHGTFTDSSFWNDGNDPHPAQYSRGGLTFVTGERSEPSLRTRIWNGLRAKRTYVTTGARMLVDFTAHDDRGVTRSIGDELAGDAVHFHLHVVPSAVASSRVPQVVRWEVWRDGDQLVGSADVAVDVLDVDFDDPAPPTDAALHPYYAKAIQDDDHVAWISPIWVRRDATSGGGR